MPKGVGYPEKLGTGYDTDQMHRETKGGQSGRSSTEAKVAELGHNAKKMTPVNRRDIGAGHARMRRGSHKY